MKFKKNTQEKLPITWVKSKLLIFLMIDVKSESSLSENILYQLFRTCQFITKFLSLTLQFKFFFHQQKKIFAIILHFLYELRVKLKTFFPSFHYFLYWRGQRQGYFGTFVFNIRREREERRRDVDDSMENSFRNCLRWLSTRQHKNNKKKSFFL